MLSSLAQKGVFAPNKGRVPAGPPNYSGESQESVARRKLHGHAYYSNMELQAEAERGKQFFSLLGTSPDQRRLPGPKTMIQDNDECLVRFSRSLWVVDAA
jgi:hypothetical protein